MLFPTSSLLQSGVVLVPQLKQFSAPTAALALAAAAALLAVTGSSLSDASGTGEEPVWAATGEEWISAAASASASRRAVVARALL